MKKFENFLTETKISDDNRIIVYHGTNSVFADFDYNFVKTTNLFGYGFYFTESLKVAKEEGGKIILKCKIFSPDDNILDMRLNNKLNKKIFNLINIGLKNINKEPFDIYYIDFPTHQIYRYLKQMFETEKDLSNFLLSCGIKGIKNDNQYRSLNYTVFDKKDIEILKQS